ncbi:MAG TPA: alpha/beta hydrolase [Acidimicrobiales bacterium]|nr:alpha/beta hydrolase [Acidimicrobiales bacterium]
MSDSETVPAWFQAALAHRVHEGRLEVGGCQIAYRRWGDPSLPSLLLVHGGGAHSRWWDHIAPFFSRECCVTALDLSGHGDSGRRPVYTFHHWAEEIMAVATSSPSDQPPVVVAHSLGGFATFASAARFGDRFEGIIIVDSPVREPSPEERAGRNREAFGPLRLYPTREDALSHFRPVPEQPALLPYVVEHVKQHSVRQVEGGWTWKFDPAFFDNIGEVGADTLASIPCRVAVLRAENGLVTPEVGQHMYKLLGRTAPVIEVPLAYHHVMLDQPIALVTAVRSLLADWRHSYSIRTAG